MGQQRRCPGLCLGDQRPAVAVGGDCETSRHVVAKERDRRGMAPVAHRQCSPGAGAVLRVGERRMRAERDVRQVDAASRDGCAGPDTTLPPLTTAGSVILTLPLMPEVTWKFPDE